MTDHIDYMDYGTYKGAPIHWRVLKQDDNALLMITDQIIETLPYNSDEKRETTWERSTLRKWLNGEFYRTAFTAEEKADIIACDVQAEGNPLYSTDPGRTTNDSVFILSIAQVEQLFKNSDQRSATGTPHAVENGLFEDNRHQSWWWLRSPGKHGLATASVHSNGTVLTHGIPVFYSSGGVRPCIWLRR